MASDENIRKLSRALRDYADEPTDDIKREAALELLDAMSASIQGAEPTSLRTFFRSVGDSLIAAQRDLDEKSKQYLQQAPVVEKVPTGGLYRIPKAGAEFRFAMSASGEAGFNVILYRSSEARRREHEQKVTFEIVSVPPPPELLDRLSGSEDVPPPSAVTDASQRNRIRQRLQQGAAALNIGDAAEVFREDRFRRALVLRGIRRFDKPDIWGYLVLIVERGKKTTPSDATGKPCFDLYTFFVPEEEGRPVAKAKSVPYKVPEGNYDLRLVLEALVQVADAQAPD